MSTTLTNSRSSLSKGQTCLPRQRAKPVSLIRCTNRYRRESWPFRQIFKTWDFALQSSEEKPDSLLLWFGIPARSLGWSWVKGRLQHIRFYEKQALLLRLLDGFPHTFWKALWVVGGEWGSQKGESTGLASDFSEWDFQNNLIKMLQNAPNKPIPKATEGRIPQSGPGLKYGMRFVCVKRRPPRAWATTK